MRTLLTILTVLLFSTTALGNNEPFAPAPKEPVVTVDEIERHWHFAFENEHWAFIETYYTNPDSDHDTLAACIVRLPPIAGGVLVSLIFLDRKRNLFLYDFVGDKWIVNMEKWEPIAIKEWYQGFNKALGFKTI